MSEVRSKEELLDIFEGWVDDTISSWVGEYGAWDVVIEDNEITEEEFDILRSFSMADYYNNWKDRVTIIKEEEK